MRRVGATLRDLADAVTDGLPRPAPYVRYADAALEVALARTDPDRYDALPDLVASLEIARDELHAEREGGAAALAAHAGARGAEVELLALLLAGEADLTRSARFALLSGADRPGRLTLGAAAVLLGGTAACVAASGPGSALRRAALLTLSSSGPWATTELVLAPGVLWALGGDATPDPDLPAGAWVAEGGGPAAPCLQLVSGPDRVRRRAVAMGAAPAPSYLVVGTPADEAGWAAVVREATLLGAGVVVELDAALPAEGRRWVERATHLAWSLTSAHDLPLSELPDRPRSELVAPDSPVTDAEWHAALGPDVARRHHLTPVQLEQVRSALPAVDGDLDRAVRRLLAGPMGRLAQRIRPTKTWDDLVLSAPKTEQLRNVVARYRHATTVYDRWGVTSASGRGVVSLFTGPSGTGKTLGAEVIAHTLELDLYRLELSSVVSKYIGETEQNLERLFEAASAGEAVLFFDEADSLFGKRSEVKDGRDRYANLEVSYLLQRLERYDGVVVLATNLPGNIDEAFLRRFHEVVDFTAPGPEERRTIWARHLADGDLPTGDLDLDRLQRFEITGGLIRNVVVGAAFRAAEDGEPLSMTHLLTTLSTELRKLGRMIRPEDFATHD